MMSSRRGIDAADKRLAQRSFQLLSLIGEQVPRHKQAASSVDFHGQDASLLLMDFGARTDERPHLFREKSQRA